MHMHIFTNIYIPARVIPTKRRMHTPADLYRCTGIAVITLTPGRYCIGLPDWSGGDLGSVAMCVCVWGGGGGHHIKDGVAIIRCVCVCVCVCVTPNSFKSCSNCEVQQ